MSRYISQNPEIMSGVPCFRGTRVPVQHLFDYLQSGSSVDEFLADFPSVTREATLGILEAARSSLFRDATAA